MHRLVSVSVLSLLLLTLATGDVRAESPVEIRVNFGGETSVAGWNSIQGEAAPPRALIDAAGRESDITLELNDPFQPRANPDVVKGELTGDAAEFAPCTVGTLFTHRGQDNPTGGFVLKVHPDKAYDLTLWASRTGNGMRWGRYTVAGRETTAQFLAAGDRTTGAGNRSNVLRFANIRPTPEGLITVIVGFPEETDPYANLGDFTYLTGMILREHPAADAP